MCVTNMSREVEFHVQIFQLLLYHTVAFALAAQMLSLSFTEPVTACKGRGTVLDECNRECSCVNGIMVDCFRVRREFTTYSKEEKKRYLQAYYKITTEEPLKSRFIKFIKIHAKWFWKGWLCFS